MFVLCPAFRVVLIVAFDLFLYVMDLPICLAKNFVNKQSVRSFDNILKPKILRNEDPSCLHFFLEDKSLVSSVTSQLSSVLFDLKKNLLTKSKDDFKQYFSGIDRATEPLTPVNKEDILTNSLTALKEIIPNNFFGNNCNRKVFRELVQIAIYSMMRQHVILTQFIRKWDLSIKPWKSLVHDKAGKILQNILVWILKYILSAMISLNFYVTTCKINADENKLFYFWKNEWQGYYDKKISDMVISKVLRRYDPYCLGKRVKRNHCLAERNKIKAMKKDIPILHLVLKPNNDYRPIVRYKNNQKEKYLMAERQNFLKTLMGKCYTSVETQFNEVYKDWLSSNKPTLHFIKSDLSNAFGSILKEKLLRILYNCHMKFQKNENDLILKRKFAKQYKEIVGELRKPLLVRSGSTVYEWTEGLVQGYKYSPALSEMYYSYLDEIYFSDLKSKSEVQLFIRVVDDYLFITKSIKHAHEFLDALFNYRNVNFEKTVVNFAHDNIKFCNGITFLGYHYNTCTMEVSRADNVYKGQMCYKIAFTSAIENLTKFLENRIGQTGIQVNRHLFNFHYNCEELVWKHIFATFCLSANKFCTILAVCHSENNNAKQFINLFKAKVAVKLSYSIIETLSKNKPDDFKFMFCINHFRYLSFKALYFCARKTPKCTVLIPLINAEIAKCNCIFGKWREHASSIDSNGEILHQAVKAVCRRTDLRFFIKAFDNLPHGFECYNHRNLRDNTNYKETNRIFVDTCNKT